MSSLFLDVHSLDVVVRFWVIAMEPGIKRTTVHVRRGSMRGTGINEWSIVRLLGATRSTNNRTLGWRLGDLVSSFRDGCLEILLSCVFRNVTLSALIIGQGRPRPDAPLRFKEAVRVRELKVRGIVMGDMGAVYRADGFNPSGGTQKMRGWGGPEDEDISDATSCCMRS